MADRNNVTICELGRPGRFTNRGVAAIPPAPITVRGVVCVCANVDMGRVHAGRVIAMVEGKKPGRDWAVN